jgi:hypothetical protein
MAEDTNGKLKKIVVAGDALRDHNIYQGTREAPHMTSGRETMMLDSCGGACLLYRIIRAIENESQARITIAEKKRNESKNEKEREDADNEIDRYIKFATALHLKKDAGLCDNHSYALWGACNRGGNSKQTIWRMTSLMGYGGKDFDSKPCDGHEPIPEFNKPDVAVLDDGALRFRFAISQTEIDQLVKGNDAWVVLKTSYPLASGPLWNDLSKRFKEKLVVIVSIGDLRRQGIGVKTGLSWERAALELIAELKANASVSELLKCRHLVIPFRSEGALWVSNGDKQEYCLIYNPAFLEGEWGADIAGDAYGYMSCFTAAVASRLLDSGDGNDLFKGIQAGLSGMRALRVEGHGRADQRPDFPDTTVAAAILDITYEYSSVEVPSSAKDYWSIISGNLGNNPGPLYGLARRVALFGEKALANVPYARFGKLFTVDRTEIESLRSIKFLIKEYDTKKKDTKPLSIAVFGPPGSGKSFGIKQIAESVLENAKILEFNLSQFSDPEQHPEHLAGAFHEIRDFVLKGKMPIVFWDEFDSGDLKWLQYLLAPMQDGAFREGQLNHPLGRCVFIFAGGTSKTMRGFAPKDEEGKEYKEFKMKKGPDFISRLSGSLDVLGPNRKIVDNDQKDLTEDICFPVRRALILRVALGLNKDQKMEIDDGVLNAFLEIDEYKHGARSLEKLAQLSQHKGEKRLKRSDLPPDEQMSLLVNREKFKEIVNRDLPFKMNAELLAPHYHEFYRQESKRKGDTVEYDTDFNNLPDDIKASNVAATKRIPEVLSHASLRLVPGDKASITAQTEKDIRNIIELSIEELAEEEHKGWMEQKYDEGWKQGTVRDNKKKIHPALVAYNLLSESDKKKDRDAVRKYPEIVKMAGFRIVQKK